MEALFGFVLVLAGTAIGSVITQIIFRRKTAYGYFVLNPVEDPEDPGTYTVGVKFSDPVIADTEKVILYKHKDSQF